MCINLNNEKYESLLSRIILVLKPTLVYAKYYIYINIYTYISYTLYIIEHDYIYCRLINRNSIISPLRIIVISKSERSLPILGNKVSHIWHKLNLRIYHTH